MNINDLYDAAKNSGDAGANHLPAGWTGYGLVGLGAAIGKGVEAVAKRLLGWKKEAAEAKAVEAGVDAQRVGIITSYAAEWEKLYTVQKKVNEGLDALWMSRLANVEAFWSEKFDQAGRECKEEIAALRDRLAGMEHELRGTTPGGHTKVTEV